MKEVEILPDGRLTTENASLYLGISKKTLAIYRCNGTSPEFIKIGNKIFYYKEALDKWISKHKACTSTVQARLVNNKGGEK